MSYPFLSDFGYFYASSLCLQQGGDPYGPCLQEKFGELASWGLGGDFLRLFPLGLWILYPLALVSFPVAATLWLLLTSAALIRSFQLTSRMLPSEHSFALCLLFFPVIKCFYFGQNSTIYLWVLLEGLNGKNRSPLLAALILSIGLTKPNIFLPIFAFILTARLIPVRSLVTGLVIGLVAQTLLLALLIPVPIQEVLSPSASWFVQSKLLPQPTLSSVFDLPELRFPLLTLNILLQLYLGKRRPGSIDSLLSSCVPLTLLLAPYLWVHDHVLLIPAWLLGLRLVKHRYLLTLLLALVGFEAVFVMNNEWIFVLLPGLLYLTQLSLRFCRAQQLSHGNTLERIGNRPKKDPFSRDYGN